MSRSSAVVFKPRNRLTQILTAADGTGFRDHVTRAERAIGELEVDISSGLQAQVAALSALCQGGEAEVFEACREIGLTALNLVESARLAGRPDVAQLAEGVWDMIDALTARGIWHTDALRVHAAALGLLLANSKPGGPASAVIAELKRLRTAIGIQP